MVDLDIELAVITSRNKDGAIESFEPVKMNFKETANLLDKLECPAKIQHEIKDQLISIAEKIIEKLDICGVLAIEFFLDKNGEIFVNEIAPRPHNSGHHTIENNVVSQYEQHIRGILNLPLIKPQVLFPAVMINILGEDGFIGSPQINGLDYILSVPNAYFHWYGKSETKPFRKMGHITFVDETLDKALETAEIVRNKISITSKKS